MVEATTQKTDQLRIRKLAGNKTHKSAVEVHFTASSKSASLNTIFALLPPSSNVTFFKFVAPAACMIFFPVRTEPVNVTLSMRG